MTYEMTMKSSTGEIVYLSNGVTQGLLEGPVFKGQDGVNGLDGMDGIDGQPGTPGSPGAKGDKGDTGVRGTRAWTTETNLIPGQYPTVTLTPQPGLTPLVGDIVLGLGGTPQGNLAVIVDSINGLSCRVYVVLQLKGNDGVGVPAGGTTGQVLMKTGDGNFQTAWVSLPS